MAPLPVPAAPPPATPPEALPAARPQFRPPASVDEAAAAAELESALAAEKAQAAVLARCRRRTWPVPTAPFPPRPAGQTILLIEDDERIAKFYTILFQAKGFNVENARDGVEGVDMASSVKPALILLDVMMPKMNGLMVLQTLRANPETEDTPVVVLQLHGAAADPAGAAAGRDRVRGQVTGAAGAAGQRPSLLAQGRARPALTQPPGLALT